MKPTQKSRRSFLKNAALLSAASAMPSIITKANASAPWISSGKAGEKVKLACIGIGISITIDIDSAGRGTVSYTSSSSSSSYPCYTTIATPADYLQWM